MSTAAAGPKPAPPKSSKGLLLVLLGLALLAIIGTALYFYFDVVSYEPEAHRHVPTDTRAALRVDGVELATFKPVREHLWPVLLEDMDGGKLPQSERIDRIDKHTGIAIPQDLREVIVASASATEWAVLVGGKIEPGRFVSGMQNVFAEEGIDGWSIKGELLVHTSSLALGQAEDGTLIIATSSKLAKACLPVTEAGDRLPLPVKNAISFGLTHQAYDDALSAMPIRLPGTEALNKIDSVSGHMTLNDKPTLQIDGVPRQGIGAEELTNEIQSLLSKLQLTMLLMPGDLGGAKSALSDAKVKPEGKVVRITTNWPYEPLDRGAKQLAEALRRGRAVTGK